ncbi:MAG: tetratricopeptide repeat protein [Bacteroidales bacterium]|jgi:tetratricopeptide (TPR) repeat protein|nr:tetratricopeptide repeat protein [Bacteroidales bacterium]
MNRRLILLISIIALASACALGQSGKKFYKAGKKFYETMKYEDAIAQYSSAIGIEPSNPLYYNARGRAFEELGKNTEAKADYDKAAVFSPKDVNTFVRLGAISYKLGQYKEALVHLNRATGLDKRNKDAYPEKVKTLLKLEKYDQAKLASDTALILLKDNPMTYYWRGVIYARLNNDFSAKKEFEKAIAKDKKIPEPRLELAEILLKEGDSQGAMAQCNEIIKNDDRNTDAYLMRSKVYKANIEFPKAIDDISKNILLDPKNPLFFMTRGLYYQEFNRHTDAINDFKQVTELEPNNPDALFARAESYEKILDFKNAMDDYRKIAIMGETGDEEFRYKASAMLKKVQDKLYDLNRESVPPVITLLSPMPVSDSLQIKGNSNNFIIHGNLKDDSKIKSFTINNEQVNLTEKNGGLEFIFDVNVLGKDKVTISAVDDYNNTQNVAYSLKRTEINPPKVMIIAPYASEDSQIYLDRTTNQLFIQGRISDESKIGSIYIDGVSGSYNKLYLNPEFSATVDILNKNSITVEAEDIYGNRTATVFTLNREGAEILAGNPMGKTWVVFIENSDYTTFASLEGPVKDISMMRNALSKYDIHQFVHRKNLTKAEMERFFSLELRDQIKANQVKSLLIWYSGHGKYVNDVGYWIPVDAKSDDEITYFNLGTLRANMETYRNYLTHLLVITDACETGPGFYQAMRSADTRKKSCDDWKATQSKSSQVFGSAERELAVDDSQFTRTFATALTNNPNACIPIEEVVQKVQLAVSKNNQQKPYFGTITGLGDEDGTFFFIAK